MRKLLLCFLLLMSQIWLVPGHTLAANLVAKVAVADKVITGTVSDASGLALPGVNVRLKGTSTGITTDPNGKYRISVPDYTGIQFCGLRPTGG
jgi:hypothetical protein